VLQGMRSPLSPRKTRMSECLKPVLVGFIKVLRTAEDSQSQIRVLTAQAGRLARWRPRRAKMIDLISTTVSSRVGPSVPG
jgi:hypothetical protein